MSLSTAACIHRINEVRAAATDYRSAYLLRMRLQRMVLAIHRYLGRRGDPVRRDEQTGLLVPVDDGESPQAVELAAVCNGLLLVSKSLAQRSATLDDRWEEGWEELRIQLDRLERMLVGEQQ